MEYTVSSYQLVFFSISGPDNMAITHSYILYINAQIYGAHNIQVCSNLLQHIDIKASIGAN